MAAHFRSASARGQAQPRNPLPPLHPSGPRARPLRGEAEAVPASARERRRQPGGELATHGELSAEAKHPRPGRTEADAEPASARELRRRPEAQVAQGELAAEAVLPPALHAALDGPLSLLALESWQSTHNERPGQHAPFESQLLSCEARLRKLDRLASSMRPPNIVVTAVACDLLHSVFETLPTVLKQLCLELMTHLESAIYSDERASDAELQEFTSVNARNIDRVPYFAIVRRQQVQVDALEQRAEKLQEQVSMHLRKRQHVLDFIIRMQHEERLNLQMWLFNFWVITFRQRQQRVARMANVVLTTPTDVATPFFSWKLFVLQGRLERAQRECESVDAEASEVATRITQLEIENEKSQKQLQDSLDRCEVLKQKCDEERQEHERLQNLWDATQPELLMSVLAQSLEFFFTLTMRSARLHKLQLRQALASKDVSVFVKQLCSEADSSDEAPVAEEIVLRWVNVALARAREAANQLLTEAADAPDQRAALEEAAEIEDALNLDEDLSDGAVLVALAAVLRAERDGKAIEAGDFDALEEADPELRLDRAFTLLGGLAPTRQAAALLVPDDVLLGVPGGTTAAFLACLLLRYPLAPEPPAPGPAEPAEAEPEAAARDSPRGPRGEPSGGPGAPEGQGPAGEPGAAAGTARQLERLLSSVEELAGQAAFEGLQDPTLLLHGGEDVQALATTSAEQLLLRWANVLLSSAYHRPVENFGSDLRDGEAIWLLLAAVAPEAASSVSENADDVEPEVRLDYIMAAVARCVDFELLTPNSIIDGQSDMLAAFFAQLFLARPSLEPRPDSLLAMHLQLLEKACGRGVEVLADPSDTAQVMRLCVELDDKWQEITLAAQTVYEANRTMESISDRMRTFLGDTLAQRARGHPRTMLDAKETRELLLYTQLNPEHYSAFAFKEISEPMAISRVEDVLKKHFRLLRDVFRNYSQANGSGNGITLEGLLKLYQDCKLRCRDLAPHHLEVLFCDHLDLSGSVERILTPQSFIEVMLQCAHLKFKRQYPHLPDQVLHLIGDHLAQNGLAQESENVFQRMAYDPRVREVLDSYVEELRLVFQLYATMDDSTTEAMQRVNTMNVKEFQMLLKHCDLLDSTLTEAAVNQVFEGIQQNATSDELDIGGGDGIGDDEELATSEFLDGLVAIAAYKYPDPFTPFSERVDALVLRVFSNLRKHWSRKRVSPQVDVLLNALQKRLR